MSLRYALDGPIGPTEWGPSKTRQSEMKNADINLIMAKYEKTGVLPGFGIEGFYADVSAVGDFREAIARVQRGDEVFMSLPANVRKEFGNDVGTFVDFCSDADKRSENMARLHELGVVVPEEFRPKPPPVVVEPPAPDVVPDTGSVTP